MIIRLDRPILNARSPEENIAMVDTWIAKTVDELRWYLGELYDNVETIDYTALLNKPSINGVVLEGDKSDADLYIVGSGGALSLSESEVKRILGANPGQIYDPTTAVQDYNDLDNRPQIEGVTLEGNKTFPALHLDSMPVPDIERILYLG